MEDKYCTHDKNIKSRKCVTVVVKEVVINVFSLVGWEHLLLFYNHYWNCLRSFVDIIFKRCG